MSAVRVLVVVVVLTMEAEGAAEQLAAHKQNGKVS